jgi:hypothetical protein
MPRSLSYQDENENENEDEEDEDAEDDVVTTTTTTTSSSVHEEDTSSENSGSRSTGSVLPDTGSVISSDESSLPEMEGDDHESETESDDDEIDDDDDVDIDDREYVACRTSSSNLNHWNHRPIHKSSNHSSDESSLPVEMSASSHTFSSAASSSLVRIGKVVMPPWMTATTTTKQQQQQPLHQLTTSPPPPVPKRMDSLSAKPGSTTTTMTSIADGDYKNTHSAQQQTPKRLLGRSRNNDNKYKPDNDDASSSSPPLSSSSSNDHDWASSSDHNDFNGGKDHHKVTRTLQRQQRVLEEGHQNSKSTNPSTTTALQWGTVLLVNTADHAGTIKKVVDDDTRRFDQENDQSGQRLTITANPTSVVERLHDKDSNIGVVQQMIVVHNEPWETTTTTVTANNGTTRSEEWMNSQKNMTITKDEPTITTRTNTTVSGTTTYGEQQQQQQVQQQQQRFNDNDTNRLIFSTPRSILLQENKNCSIQSTLGGSMNEQEEDDDNDNDRQAEEEDFGSEQQQQQTKKAIKKSIPIWAKARENLRSTATLDRPKKTTSLLVSTKDDLRPIPPRQPTIKDTTINNNTKAAPFSTLTLRSTPPTKEQPKRSGNGSSYSNKDNNNNHNTGILSSSPPSLPQQALAASNSTNQSQHEEEHEPEETEKEKKSSPIIQKQKQQEQQRQLSSSHKMISLSSTHTEYSLSYYLQATEQESTGVVADAPVVSLTRARSNNQQPQQRQKQPEQQQSISNVTRSASIRTLGVDEKARRPTISSYDNWELVKAHYMPSLDPESVEVSTLTKGDRDDDDDDDDTNNNTDTVSAKSSSAASDWGFPIRNQNTDDSSWVNPARPVDPERKDRIKEEVDRVFLHRLGQSRLQKTSAVSTEAVSAAYEQLEPSMPAAQETTETPTQSVSKEEKNGGRTMLLSHSIATESGSFDNNQGWVPISKSTTIEMSNRDRNMPLDDTVTWNMPSKATAAKAGVYRKTEETATKDYRYTYITARPASAEPNSIPSMSSYWDKVRQNYFDDRDIPVPTEGPVTAVTYDSYSRPSWMDEGDRSVESGSWLPPGGINRSSNQETTRSIPLGNDHHPIPSNGIAVKRESVSPEHDDDHKSVITSDSKLQPPEGGHTRLSRVDFTGQVSSTYHSTQYKSDGSGSSSSSDHIPWVPNPDDISSADSGEVKDLSEFAEEQRALSSPLKDLPSHPSQRMTMVQPASTSTSSEDNSGWKTGSEDSIDDNVGSSVWTSALRLESDDDDDDDNDDDDEFSNDYGQFDPNPSNSVFTQNLSGHSIDFVREEEAQKHTIVEQQQQQQQQQQLPNPQGRRAFYSSPPSRGIVRNLSNNSSSASVDSVLSYTGRISFKTSPEVITFVDGPNEDRGTHYTRYGRMDLSSKRGSSSSSSYTQPSDPCIYYTLCCIMVAVPTTILIVMFMFVIDMDGEDDNGGPN